MRTDLREAPASIARAAQIGAVLVLALLRAATDVRGLMSGVPPSAIIADRLAWACERLGPAFIKIGQLLSTRVDIISPAACRALARLRDRLPPVAAPVAARAVGAHLAGQLSGTLTPVAAGAVACVYHARLRDGREIAVKVRRPRITRLVARDLALFRHGARLLQRLPGLRGAPLADVAGQLGDALLAQLDFLGEARALGRLRANLRDQVAVRVPGVLEEFCRPDVLVMEYVPGLDRSGQGPDRREAVVAALRAVYHMLFIDGFVHCDLHPGNLHPMPDGSVVIVDAGFFRQLTDTQRRAFATFFYRMTRGDGAGCAEIVLSTVLGDAAGHDAGGFRADMEDLVRAVGGSRIGEFDLLDFAVRLFAVQREHGYYADPQFVFPILSLIVMEGTLREACPEVDFQTEALPFVLRGLMRRDGPGVDS
ncbi:ABC1 kinase family protein [Nonomuraea sp. NPDC047897]|uniref:ABC1 kinase family protein n=1 Tax=Nonomuraea sp. NPDC047897 TaxID=3364346 RepID=UPI0037198BF2